MTVVQQNGATVGSYVYNASGERVMKTVGSASTRFVYGKGSQLLSELGGTTARDYIAVGGVPLAVADGGSLGFITADGLGSPRAVTSPAGAVLWAWPYASNPFGESQPVSVTGYVLNLRFPGQYQDSEAGLKYNVNRSFDAATGRYLGSDPTGLAAGPSTYGYVESNPLVHIDPLGLDDTICMNNPSMCGMEHNAPAKDSFVFISVEAPIIHGNVAEGAAEDVFLFGHSRDDGWYGATIVAGGVQVGTDTVNYARFQGTESSGGRVEPITLNEGNIGEGVVKLGGVSVGMGTYSTTSCGKAAGGAYVHASFVFRGYHVAVGIGGG